MQAERILGPVARVAVDMPLPHLDRPFDYAVPAELADSAVPGARVRVRFAGRLRDGFILERRHDTDAAGPLAALQRVVSTEPVLTPALAGLIRAVADHYAGTFSDTVRLAIPPRHAATEKADPAPRPQPGLEVATAALARYPSGEGLLAALRRGEHPRAAWTLVPAAHPAADWCAGFVEAAASTLASGRGALLLVPDQRDLKRLAAECERVFGGGTFATLTAEDGPSVRYRNFLAVVRGDVRLVLGTRAAAYAPVRDLGLIALWDDGDDLYAEPRTPYPHTREVVALRASQQRCGLLLAGYGRTSEVQALIDREWLTPLQLDIAERRRIAPAVRAAGAEESRVPRSVFETIRSGLASGPVLVQVPRAGYVVRLSCQKCRVPALCLACGHPLIGRPGVDGLVLNCTACGAPAENWRCPTCGGARLRAPRVGVHRTAEELGRAFPQAPVTQSSGDHVVAAVDDQPRLVLATPGAEPVAAAGYAAAILLDAELLVQRAELRSSEEALRRWLQATSLVRPGADGGTVLVVGEPGLRAVQALLRLDAPGLAVRELADRDQAGFPPCWKLISIEGSAPAVADLRERIAAETTIDGIGPVPVAGSEDLVRLVLRCRPARAAELVGAVKSALNQRSARKAEGAVRVRVDPQVIQ